MKKTFAFLLVFMLTISVAVFSFATDYSSMSDDELLNELKNIRAELAQREFNPEKIMLESDGITVSLSGEIQEKTSSYSNSRIIFPIVAVNNCDKTVWIIIDKISINGWEIEDYNNIELDPGKKAKESFEYEGLYEKTDIESLSDVIEVEFYGSIVDPKTGITIKEDLRKTIIIE